MGLGSNVICCTTVVPLVLTSPKVPRSLLLRKDRFFSWHSPSETAVSKRLDVPLLS